MKRGTLKLKSLRTSNIVSFIQEPISNTQIRQLKVFILINNNIRIILIIIISGCSNI